MGSSAALRETQPVKGGSVSWNGSQLSASSIWIYFWHMIGYLSKIREVNDKCGGILIDLMGDTEHEEFHCILSYCILTKGKY